MRLHKTINLIPINKSLGLLELWIESNVIYINIHSFVKIFNYSNVSYLCRYYGLVLYKREYVEFNKLSEVFIRGRKDYLKQVYRLISKNLNYNVVPSQTKESYLCENIIELLDDKSIEYTRQYKCGKYRIDLYIPEKNLVIEINENGHSDRSEIYEEKRELYITNKLDCVFCQINPDEPKFSIYKMIRTIEKLIK